MAAPRRSVSDPDFVTEVQTAGAVATRVIARSRIGQLMIAAKTPRAIAIIHTMWYEPVRSYSTPPSQTPKKLPIWCD